MFSNVPLGVYFPKKSIIHGLQARTKLLLLFWFIIVLIIANRHQWHFAPYIVILCLISSEIALARISPRAIWQRIWLILVLTLFSAVFVLFASYRDNHIFYTFGPWHPLYGSVLRVLLMCEGVFAVLLFSSLLPGIRVIWRGSWLKYTRVPMLFLFIVIAIFCWFTRGHPVDKPFGIGPLLLTYYGVWVTMTEVVVFLSLYISSLLLTMTTMPVALIEGMTLLLAPLRRLKLPVDDFALMTLLALRFIPTLLEEAEQLIKAQTSRGADVLHGTLRERVQSLSMLFLPLVQGILRRASDLAVALEARGYQSEGKQTLLYEVSFAPLDYVVLGIVVVLTAGSLLL